MKPDFLWITWYSRKFPSVGMQTVVIFFGLPNRKNMQNVEGNDKKYKGI